MNSADKNLSDVLIAARDLVLRAEDQYLLDHISLAVHSGEIVTVIGPNGAGKSTLIKALLGVIKPGSGFIEKKPELKIGYVPQGFSVDGRIPLTVERLLTLTHKASVQTIIAVLEETGIEDLRKRDVSTLSGGELQRALLARALIRDPHLLVLDEAVQGVDFAGEIKLYDLIAEIRNRRNCGILMVSHDLHVVMAESDRVICLNRHICCEGHPEAVQNHPEYARLFGPAAISVGLYHHAHDHGHDMSGDITPLQNSPKGKSDG